MAFKFNLHRYDGEGDGGRSGGEDEEREPRPRVLLGADVEVLRRLARRVSAAAASGDGSDGGRIGGGGGVGGVLDSLAEDVAAAHFASAGRPELVDVPFDNLPDDAARKGGGGVLFQALTRLVQGSRFKV